MLPHPLQASSTPAQISANFTRVAMTRCTDAHWHYSLVLRKDTKLGPGGELPPPATGEFVSIGLFQYRSADIEVLGTTLEREIDPVDGLEAFLLANELEVVSRQPAPTTSGMSGDFVVRWTSEGKPFVGRLTAIKGGSQLAIVFARCAESEYQANAEDFLAAVSTFKFTDTSLGYFAEEMTALKRTTPWPWETLLPQSWSVHWFPERDGFTSLEARSSLPKSFITPKAPALQGSPGLLTYGVFERDRIERPSELAAELFQSLASQQLTPTDRAFSEESPPSGGATQSWFLCTEAKGLASPMELRARIMLRDEGWVLASVLGVLPTLPEHRVLWMANKRALDIACLAFGPVSPPDHPK